MVHLRSGLVIAGVVLVIVMVGAVPAYASNTLQQCMDQAGTHNGEPPNCTKINGSWVASWPTGTTFSTGGISGGLLALIVLVVAAGIGVTLWKVGTAQKLAKQSGMDPGLATKMALLTEGGLDATYLAANLRQSHATDPTSEEASAPITKSAAERLTELAALHDEGIVTQAEYDEQRQAIINSV